jgi:hypothetical protein
MTIAEERTRALVWAGSFLIQIARDDRLPLDVRKRAIVVARHFPTIEDVAHMAMFTQLSGFGVELAPLSETEWADGCACGPLRYSTRFTWPEERED